jgi:cell division septal protein FtsQ
MSSGGRWRLVMAVTRVTICMALVGSGLWAAWLVVNALREDPARIPAAAKSVPMKSPELKSTDGVLDNAWLSRTLELPPGISLLELDLERLQARLLTDQQVITATLTRQFPDRLLVQITERTPVARVRVDLGGVQRDLLVARDGAVFFGTGFDPGMLKTLPWLAGIAMVRDGAWFRPIAGMVVVARLLADAQFSAPHLYHSWQSLSLTRLAEDREIEVTLKNGTRALFTAKGSFFLQLAHFDYVLDRLARNPNLRARVDLTLGREVPVTLEPIVATDAKQSTHGGGASGFPFLSPSQQTTKREL